MKVVFTGGGTGGHFYPLIAVAQEMNHIVDQEHLANAQWFYFSDTPYDEASLYEQHIKFIEVPAGKMRMYFSLENILDVFKMAWGMVVATWKLFRIYPDVVFAKGGYASFPTIMAAKILRIPLIIHESDSVPGRVTKIAGKFADYVAVSYKEATKYFPKDKTAHTGQPVRHELQRPITDGAYEYLRLEPGIPVIAVFGGSLGAQIINDNFFDTVLDLLDDYQIVHMVGKNNFESFKTRAATEFSNHPHYDRYHVVDFLNALATSMVAGVGSVIINRAGSMLFEIAAWKMPAIIIPIKNSHGNHQKHNAFNYARVGGCTVIEEDNLTPHVLETEIRRVLEDEHVRESMKKGAQQFAQKDAALVIAKKIIEIAESHQKEE